MKLFGFIILLFALLTSCSGEPIEAETSPLSIEKDNLEEIKSYSVVIARDGSSGDIMLVTDSGESISIEGLSAEAFSAVILALQEGSAQWDGNHIVVDNIETSNQTPLP